MFLRRSVINSHGSVLASGVLRARMAVGKFAKRQHKKAPPKVPPPSKSTRQTGLPGNENRLFPAFNSTHPGKKIILVIDNASYHHQMNKDY